MSQRGENRTNGWATEWAYRRLSSSPLTPKQGVEKSPFQIAATWLEIDGNVNGAHLRTHWLG